MTYLSADHGSVPSQKANKATTETTTAGVAGATVENSIPSDGLKLSVLFSNKNQSCHGVVVRDCLYGNLFQHNVPVSLKDDFEGDLEKLFAALSGITAGRSSVGGQEKEGGEENASRVVGGESSSLNTSNSNSKSINSSGSKLSVPGFNIISITVQRSDLKNSNMDLRTFRDRLKNILHTPSFPNDSIGYSSLLAVSSQTDTAKIVR